MISPRLAIHLLAPALLVSTVAASAAAQDSTDEQLRAALDTRDVVAQGRALTHLAWDQNDNHELSFRAREALVAFGGQGLQPIAEALDWAPPELSADIMLALVEAEKRMTFGTSPYTTVAMDQALWDGSPDAKRVAMRHLSRRPVGLMLLSVIDAAYEYPQLSSVVIETLVAMADDRARFFLAEQVEQGDPRIRRQGVEAMATIGGQCLQYLRAWALSDQPELRANALQALLPTTTVGDLSTLYEYFAMFPDDDPDLLAALRSRAEILEELFETQQAIDSASPPLDD